MADFTPEGAIKPSSLEVDSYDKDKAAYRSVAIMHGVDANGNLVPIQVTYGGAQVNQINTDDIYKVLQDIKAQLQMPVWYVDGSNSLNTSGTTTATIASGTVTTVSTVTTLANQTNIGGFSADRMAENAAVTEWAVAIRPLYI